MCLRASPLPVLTSVRQIRTLTREQANRGYPVHIRGVVTFFYVGPPPNSTKPDGLSANMFIQDSSGGNWVATTGRELPLKTGDLIDLLGVTAQTDFAPDILHAQWRVLGRAPLPSPVRAEFGPLASTREDSRWVEIEGIVRSARIIGENLQLDIAMDGGQVTAYIPNFQAAVPASLIDARVRMRGVCGAIFSAKNQVRGVNLFVPALSQLQILESGTPDPFAIPAQSVGSILRFTVAGAAGHRVKVQGVVTLQRRGRFVFIQGDDGNIRADSDQSIALSPGQRIEAVGFPVIGEYGPTLHLARLRPIGQANAPAAQRTSEPQLLTEDTDGQLIQIDAQLLDRTSTPQEQLLITKIGSALVQAELEDSSARAQISKLEPGSRLRLTGVLSIKGDARSNPGALRLLLRSPLDIRVLSRPSWWTVRTDYGYSAQ